MANKPIFDRLVGLETEYAIRFHADDPQRPAPTKLRLYELLVQALGRRVLTAEAKHFKSGHFLANGGAVWFESSSTAIDTGLIEGATPECRGPRQVVQYQRAQDRLIAEATTTSLTDGEFQLIKNDRDSRGNIYGAQENYEVAIARGWRLLVWRAGLIALMPLLLLTWLFMGLLIVATVLYFAAAGSVYVLSMFFSRRPRQVARALLGRFDEVSDSHWLPPVWLEYVMRLAERAITGPLAAALFVLSRVTAFHHARRALIPFLVSRPIISGSGMVDGDGNFHLSDKAPGINCVLGLGGFVGDRPMFSLGNLFKTVFAESFLSWRDYRELFAARQRLQIAIGDSNMAEVAEYLRVGTTLLVLDALEAGALKNLPRVRRPIRSLRTICSDATLAETIPLCGGKRATALQIQRYYCEACRRFVDAQADAPPDARDIVRRWEETLDALEYDRQSLVGSIDWVTKKFLLDEAGDGASWEARKKIDLRYHELSPEGYFERLKSTGMIERIISLEEIDRAVRVPPNDTPATTRGHYIREFANGGEPFQVNWRWVYVGRGRKRRIIRLASFRRPASGESAVDRDYSSARDDGP